MFIFLAVVGIILYLIPKIWAKRWNLLSGALLVALLSRPLLLFWLLPRYLPGKTTRYLDDVSCQCGNADHDLSAGYARARGEEII